MIKAYLLKDNLILEDGSKGSQIFLDLEAACEFEHSESELHEGWFVSEGELEEFFNAGRERGLSSLIGMSDWSYTFKAFMQAKKKEIL